MVGGWMAAQLKNWLINTLPLISGTFLSVFYRAQKKTGIIPGVCSGGTGWYLKLFTVEYISVTWGHRSSPLVRPLLQKLNGAMPIIYWLSKYKFREACYQVTRLGPLKIKALTLSEFFVCFWFFLKKIWMFSDFWFVKPRKWNSMCVGSLCSADFALLTKKGSRTRSPRSLFIHPYLVRYCSESEIMPSVVLVVSKKWL